MSSVPALFIYPKRTFSENKSNGKGLDRQLIKEASFRWGMLFFFPETIVGALLMTGGSPLIVISVPNMS